MKLGLFTTSIAQSIHLVIFKTILVLSFIVTSSTAVEAMAAEPKKIPSPLKLHYADMNFWRAECIRMSFFLGDVPFEDVRHTEFKELKESGKLTFGAAPVLEVGEDSKILSQTQAIAVYAAKLAGIHPTDDDWSSAKIDECINGCTDVTGTIGSTFRMKDEEKIAARKVLIDSSTSPPGRLWMHMNGLEKICTANGCDKGFSVGSSLTVADLAIWRLMGWMDSGNLDGIPVNWGTSTFPALAKLVAAVDANPKVQEWKSKHAKFYDKK